MWSFILNSIPWQVQAVAVAFVAALLVLVVGHLFGWKYVRPVIAPLVGVVAAIGLLSRARQQGYRDRRTEEERAQKRADDIADQIQDDTRKLPDGALDKEVDRWSRH
jgi:Flp pilus assembly protein TadB